MERLGCLLIGYLFGMIQTSYILGRTKGIDIRDYGSGNAGTTNTLRTLGRKYGALCFAGDVLKCVLAVALAVLIFGKSCPDEIALLKIWAGVGCVLGHDYPLHMGFRGGKGMAVTGGLVIIFGPWTLLISLAVFVLVFVTTHYVSLASLTTYVAFVLQLIILGSVGYFHMTHGHLLELYIVALLLMALCFWRHRTNIQRLREGSERKTYLGKKS